MGLASLFTGFALGLSLAIPPGPVNALIAREATRRGAGAAIRAGVAAPIVDTLYMVLVLAGLPLLVDVRPYLPWLGLLGVPLMGFLAWSTVRTTDPPWAQPGGTPAPSRAFASVFALSLANPLQIGWWLTAGAALLWSQGGWGVGGFLSAIFGWVFLFAHGMARGAKRWDGLEPLVTVLSADLLVAFALLLLAQVAAGNTGVGL